MTAALLPLLQRTFADAVSSREFSLRHFHLPANGFHVDRLRPNLFELYFAAIVRGTGFAADNGSVPTDRFNLGLDYGNVSTTRRHRVLSTFTYQLPGADWKPNGFAGQVGKAAVGGWQVSGILLLQTGQFLTPITGGVTDPSGTNVDARANDRPDYAGTSYGNLPSEQRTIFNWFDRAAFVTPNSNIGRFGMTGSPRKFLASVPTRPSPRVRPHAPTQSVFVENKGADAIDGRLIVETASL